MDCYPPELVTPPLALVALLGCPELHSSVGEFLRSQHRPPINSIGLADPQSASRLLGERKSTVTSHTPPVEILKADWFAKHRQRRPAVAVLFLSRDSVLGDPASWLRCTQQADAVKAATRARGARAVIIIVQPAASSDIPDERALQLCKQAGIDRRCLLSLCLTDMAGLVKLGRSLHEQAGVFYLDESRRVLSMHAERRAPPPELNARISFKAGALAEFRADWSTAVKTYQTAYSQVQKVPLGTTLPLQHWYELTSVAEQMHIKVVTLLLHQHRSQEALSHFQQHLAAYRHPPPQLAPVPLAAGAAHWGWVGRQYQVMGELMNSRVDPAHLPPQRECHPAYFFLCAATAFIERRRAAQQTRESRTATQVQIPAEVGPGRAVGQLTAQGGRRLSDPEFVAWLEVQEVQVNHAKAGIAMLTTAHELYKRGSQRANRLIYHIGALLAREHLAVGDVDTAQKLLHSIAGVYRKEQWGVPLAAALLELRECAHQQKQAKEHVECSLELACQEHFLGDAQRGAIAQAAVGALQSRTPPPSPHTSPRTSDSGESMTGLPLQLHIQSPSSGLFSCFALQLGFAPMAPLQDPGADGLITFGVALWSSLPIALPIRKLEVVFLDGEGTYSHAAQQQEEPASLQRPGAQQQLTLHPHKWATALVEWKPRRPGRLKAQAVIAYTGDSSAISWSLEHVSPEHKVVGRAGAALSALQNPFMHTPIAGQIGHVQMDVPSRHQPPKLQVQGAGFAMVGEQMPVSVVTAAADAVRKAEVAVKAEYLEGGGHSELQILVDNADGTKQPLKVPLQLPDLEREAGHTVQLLVPVSRPGQVHLTARLQYHTGQESTEVCEQLAGLEVVVEQPFTLDCQFSAPPRVQSIMPPQAEPSQFLAPAAGHAGNPKAAATLPLGPPAVMVACVTAMAPCQVVIHEIQIEPASSGSSQAAVVASATAVAPQRLAALRKGDKHSCVVQVQADAPGQDLPLGHLQIVWARAGSAKLSEAAVPSTVTTRLPLPLVSFQKPLLQASMLHATEVTAGSPFVLKVTLQSHSPLLQTLDAVLMDSTGFVTSGPRNVSVAVLPHQDSVLAWQMVAYSSGYHLLPQIELTSRQHSVVLNASYGRRVHVLPAKLPTAADMQGQSNGLMPSGVDNLASSMSQLTTQSILV